MAHEGFLLFAAALTYVAGIRPQDPSTVALSTSYLQTGNETTSGEKKTPNQVNAKEGSDEAEREEANLLRFEKLCGLWASDWTSDARVILWIGQDNEGSQSCYANKWVTNQAKPEQESAKELLGSSRGTIAAHSEEANGAPPTFKAVFDGGHAACSVTIAGENIQLTWSDPSVDLTRDHYDEYGDPSRVQVKYIGGAMTLSFMDRDLNRKSEICGSSHTSVHAIDEVAEAVALDHTLRTAGTDD